MAAKKAELEADYKAYQKLISKGRSSARKGLYRETVALAAKAFKHIDGMMQYARRYQKRDFESLEAVELVLKYAPYLLDYESLSAFEALLSEQRRIEKNTSESLTDKLREARHMMWNARALWDLLENNPGHRQDKLCQVLEGNQDGWRTIAEMWEKMRLVERVSEGGSYRLQLASKLGTMVRGKCSSCGAVEQAPMGMYLGANACPTCNEDTNFVILPSDSQAEMEDASCSM